MAAGYYERFTTALYERQHPNRYYLCYRCRQHYITLEGRTDATFTAWQHWTPLMSGDVVDLRKILGKEE